MREFACMECGRRFRTARAAERAANEGCPNCGGTDVDLNVESETRKLRERNRKRLYEVLDPVLGPPICVICGSRHEPDDCPERVDIEEMEAAAEIWDREQRRFQMGDECEC